MLEVGVKKIASKTTTIKMILGDSENMPEDNYFDAITAFGVHFETLEKVWLKS
jgi:ubiquinone/menaquinone biosynthesis C-methylase UbiE